MEKTAQQNQTKVIIYGGNGFVGTRVAERLSAKKTDIVCLSRTGHRPLHLKDEKWSESVRWCKGDANTPNLKLLESADVMICLVGATPLSTFSKKRFTQQLFMNGTACTHAIEAAAECGIKKIVLLRAHTPLPMRTDHLGYTQGKCLALDAAKKFAARSSKHTAIALQPCVIYGKRYLPSGKVVARGSFMTLISKIIPWAFVSVEKVADCIVDAALSNDQYAGELTIIGNSDIKHARHAAYPIDSTTVSRSKTQT